MKKLATIALSLALAASLCIPSLALTVDTGSSAYPYSLTFSSEYTGTATITMASYEELDMGAYYIGEEATEITVNYLPASTIITSVIDETGTGYTATYLKPIASIEDGYQYKYQRDLTDGTALADLLSTEGSILVLSYNFVKTYIAIDPATSVSTEVTTEEAVVEEVVEEVVVEEVVEEEVVVEELEALTSFSDVPAGAAYEDAVLWAMEAGVTQGYDDGTFRPDATCTRGQVVTFLYRALGEPEATITENPFSDVSEDSPYYDAILWAVGEGITTGYEDGTFNPNATCTSAHVITFLYRSLGEPEATVESELATDASAAFVPAINWADEISLLEGMDFVSGNGSPRSDIVTYLYLMDGTVEMA